MAALTIFGDVVTAGPITFNEPAEQPPEAVVWRMDGMLGWDETAEMDVLLSTIGGGVDGAIASSYFPYKERYLTLGGYVIADSRANCAHLEDVLARDAFPRNTDIELTRFEDTPKKMTVRRAGKFAVTRVGPTQFRWVMPVVAQDPLKYALDEQSYTNGPSGVSTGGFSFPLTFPLIFTSTASGDENAIDLYNWGTAAMYPNLVTLTGPLLTGGWRVSNDTTGEYIRFDVGLSLGDVLTIDFRNGIALLNGFAVSATITGDFWKLVPGANRIKLYADYDPATTITITANSAWEN